MKDIVVRQSLNRGDLFPVSLHRQNRAGLYSTIV
jgi:hypothetical protein